ncbi:MAG TPA: iron-sulfur cluster assembly protein [Thermodesulfobacteriota bacterium]
MIFDVSLEEINSVYKGENVMGLGDMLSKIFNSEGIKEPKSREWDNSVPPVENIDDKKGGSPEGIVLKDRPVVDHEGNLSSPSTANEGGSVTESGGAKRDSTNEGSTPAEVTEENVLEVLSGVYDPEIPIDIVNLGLIYGVDIEDGNVHIKMTMTAPGCPSSAEIAAESRILIEELPGVKSATIEIVWDPPWDPSRMSEDARQSMGL